MSDENETTEVVEVECGTCVHLSKSPGDWEGCGCGLRELAPRAAFLGPHTCEFWKASDAHRLALATEAQASALSFLAAFAAEWLTEEEEEEDEPEEKRCGVCLTVFGGDACPVCAGEVEL